MFLLYLLGCGTSIQFDFLAVLVVFKFVVVLLLVVRGGTVCLPTPPSPNYHGLSAFTFVFSNLILEKKM